MLILISGLALALSGDQFTLNLTELASRSPGGSFGLLCYLGFLVGFGVKLPMFPLHTWLPEAHGEANAPVSMLLAGVLLKMGGKPCSTFRCAGCPPHPGSGPGDHRHRQHCLRRSQRIRPGQRQTPDRPQLREPHGLLGIGAVMPCVSGAMLQMVSHGLIAAAMFFVTGVFYERTKTLSIPNMGGRKGADHLRFLPCQFSRLPGPARHEWLHQ